MSLSVFSTGIESFDNLLPAKDGDGIARLTTNGFFGVIFGAAGSGKSVFSLQLCCRFAALRPGRHAVYLTYEPAALIRTKICDDFHFNQPIKIGEREVKIVDTDYLKKWKLGPQARSTITIITLPLESAGAGAYPKQSKLVNVFQLINGHFCCNDQAKLGTDEDPKTHLLVAMDNAETIADGAYDQLIGAHPAGTPEKRDHYFYKRLRNWCAHHRLNTWFAFEEEQAQTSELEEAQIATRAQSYAADIVVRLGVTVFPAGYRERSLEIVKAKNQFYRRGRHHYSIHGYSEKTPEAPTGIIVYPSLPTQLHVLGGKPDPGGAPPSDPQLASTSRTHRLGIKAVDEAVLKRKKPSAGYLAENTVSVLVSDLDSLPSEIALHFALQDAQSSLYISTLHRSEELFQMMHNHLGLRNSPAQLQVLHLAPEHISESKLLQDIQHTIEKAQAKRVILDNIFALQSKFPLIRSEQHFLTALFQLFRKSNAVALIVDTVEVGEGRNPLDKSFAAGIVDHVFVLRHVEFQSHTRKVFSVLTLAGLHEPQELWEIESTSEGISAQDRFEFYKGVLTGHAEPVRITLSLYADSPGSPLHHYLRTQRKVLRQVFGQNIEIHTCHPEDYVALQQAVATGDLRALGDCHVISIDEIWLEELIANNQLEYLEPEWFDTDPASGEPTDEWARSNYVTAALDLALAQPKAHKHHPLPSQTLICGKAMPDRNNCGILAYNPACLSACVRNDSEWPPAMLGPIFEEMDHLIALRADCDAGVSWSDLVDLQSRFVGGISGVESPQSWWPQWHDSRKLEPDPALIRQITGARAGATPDRFPGVFTFSMENRESCVSFLLELVLSALDQNAAATFVQDGQLDWGNPNDSGNAWVTALVQMLRLLDPWDIHRISDAWLRPSPSERPCLFSRQWFSSWGVLGLRFPHLRVFELPPGKAGAPTPVSGAWYLGILHGGTALKAGAALIRRLTSRTEELHKFNYGVGLPVRKELYQTECAIEGIPPLPYRQRFCRLAEDQTNLPGTPCPSTVTESTCPFYRSRIRNFAKVSPLLMGLLTSTARAALLPDYRSWLTRRDVEIPHGLVEAIANLANRAKTRCEMLQ
jgi:KaiC/GvpD/RAD55 family RecA-like ATPase